MILRPADPWILCSSFQCAVTVSSDTLPPCGEDPVIPGEAANRGSDWPNGNIINGTQSERIKAANAAVGDLDRLLHVASSVKNHPSIPIMIVTQLLLALGTASVALGATSWIVAGATWKDTKGNKIDAHGGGIVQRGDTFYWTGQSASQNETPVMYSSTDLLNWTPLGNQCSIQQMWRPKFAKPNGGYWIYGQVNRYVQALESSTMVGGYKVHGSAVSLPPSGYTYSDTGMFEDPTDSTWYVLTSADHNTVQVNMINSDGSVGDRVNKLSAGDYEAPGMFYADGIYFLIVSHKTGWRGNPNQMFYASSITGSWNGPHPIAPDSDNTYGSQNTFELVIKGSKTTTYIYMGDLWDSNGGPSSNYLWLPMSVDTSSKTVTLDYHSMWKVDVSTGEVSFPSTKKRYEAEDAKLSGRAAVTSCEHCLTKRSVHRIDHESDVVFENVTGTGEPEWISFHYTVNDPTAGDAFIFVNDEHVPMNVSDMNSRAGYYQSTPVQLTLKPGESNTIRFSAVGTTDFEVYLDGIELHE